MSRSRDHWIETAVFTLSGAIVLAILTRLAFRSFFFAEVFVYLGSYRAAGDSFWGAVFSPHGHMFFRPTLWALNLPWNLWLPADPFTYHVRNFAFIVIDLALLHRILLRLVPTPSARACAMCLAAVSKVHFTTIGYIASFSSVLMVTLTMMAFLFVMRSYETRRNIDYVAALVCTALVVCSKDYGVVIAICIATVARITAHESWRAIAIRWLVPCAVIFAIYLGLRWQIVGGLPSEGVYAPRIDAATTLRKVASAMTTAANASVFNDGTTGAPGLAGSIVHDRRAEAAFAVAFAIMVLLTALAARRRTLMIPIAWGAAFMAPTFLTRNEEMYYWNDLAFALAVLVGAALSALPRKWTAAWTCIVIILGINAGISQRSSRYVWQEVADDAAQVERVLPSLRRCAPAAVVFTTSNRPLWSFALTADGLAPMIAELSGLPHLRATVAQAAAPGAAIVDIDGGWRFGCSGVATDDHNRSLWRQQ